MSGHPSKNGHGKYANDPLSRPASISHRASSAPTMYGSPSHSYDNYDNNSPIPYQTRVSSAGNPHRRVSSSIPGGGVSGCMQQFSSSDPNKRNIVQSTFKQCLKDIPIPQALREGIDVLHVFANGKTVKSNIRLSDDKFTLHVVDYNNSASTIQHYNTDGTVATSGASSSSSSGWFKRKQEKVHRKIDIGSIHRIQRGYTQRYERFNSRNRQGSRRSLLQTASSNSQTNLMASLNPSSNHSNGTNKTANNLEDEDRVIQALDPTKSFSIIFRGDWTLDMMLLSGGARLRDDILDSLDQLLQTYQKSKVKVLDDVLLLRYVWLDADKDNRGTINLNELGKVITKINYHSMKQKQLTELYDKFGKMIGLDRKERRKGLTFEQTCTLLHKIKRDSWTVKPINTYWNKLFGEFMNNGKPRMNVSDQTFLTKFKHGLQGETSTTIQDVHRIFEHLNAFELPHIADGSSFRHNQNPTPRIDKSKFEAMLLSEANDAFDPSREQYDERLMNRPISEYWVNSSHNTYLTGDQLTSHSSVDMYSHALYRGCKCLELDVWDEKIGPDGEPIPVVWHGHTLTSKILFKDIIRAIKLFLNFHPDTFPLILSFENHCTIPYQEVMAQQLVEILGDALYIPKEESLNGRLPSPLDLRGYVVIKGRRPNDLDFGLYDFDDDVSDDGAPSTIFGSDLSSTVERPKKVTHGVCPELARLSLFHGTKLKSWDISIMNPTHHMHSFSENKVRSLARKTDRKKWVIYNQSHLSRTYPAGSRVDSGNYMPLLAWSVGCQLVSLNFQTHDAALRLNDGRFRENGGCGYVLKPTELLSIQEKTKEDPPKPMQMSIRILSGSCLPKLREEKKSSVHFVRVSVFDVKNEKEISTSFQTSTVPNNGFFPIWNEEKFSFTIENSHVAMLQLSIFDKDGLTDELVASASIPISCLRLGLRSVKLFDASNTRSGAFDFASLLIEVKKKGRKISELVQDRPKMIERRHTDHLAPPASSRGDRNRHFETGLAGLAEF